MSDGLRIYTSTWMMKRCNSRQFDLRHFESKPTVCRRVLKRWDVGRVLRGPTIAYYIWVRVIWERKRARESTYDGRDRWLCVWKLPGTHASIHTYHEVKHRLHTRDYILTMGITSSFFNSLIRDLLFLSTLTLIYLHPFLIRSALVYDFNTRIYKSCFF